jgi:gliding motility-associated-like protein
MASPDQTTSYTVSITDTSCRFTRYFTVVLTVNPLPNVEAGKSNDINCRQRQARLSATGALQYTWNPSSTLSSTTIPNPVVNPTITTSYVVTGTDQNGCKNSDTIVVSAKTSKDAYAVPNAFTPNGDGLNDCFGIKGWSDATDVRFIIWNRFGEKVFETNNINDCWDGRFKGNPADVGNYVYYISALTPCGYLVKKDNLVLFR